MAGKSKRLRSSVPHAGESDNLCTEGKAAPEQSPQLDVSGVSGWT
jgi:hypothetical protein